MGKVIDIKDFERIAKRTHRRYVIRRSVESATGFVCGLVEACPVLVPLAAAGATGAITKIARRCKQVKGIPKKGC